MKHLAQEHTNKKNEKILSLLSELNSTLDLFYDEPNRNNNSTTEE